MLAEAMHHSLKKLSHMSHETTVFATICPGIFARKEAVHFPLQNFVNRNNKIALAMNWRSNRHHHNKNWKKNKTSLQAGLASFDEEKP